MNSTEIKVWKCEKCGKAYIRQDVADKCCTDPPDNHCRVCGCELLAPRLVCFDCWMKEMYEKAQKIKYSDYQYKIIYDDSTERYFDDIDDLKDYYDDMAIYAGEEPKYPEWVFGCKEVPFAVDIDGAIERAEEEMYEDFAASEKAVDLSELYDFLKTWNTKQTAKAYFVDYNIVVLLNE